MKKLYAILLSVLCLATVAGCNKFLDMKPTNSLDSESSINSVADAQVALNGLMRQMLSGSFYGRNFFLYGDAKGGDFTVVSNGRGYDGLYTFGHTPTSGTYSGFWTVGYKCIAQINSTLEAISKVKGETSDYDDIEGQLYTLRGMLYFDLARLYGRDYAYDKTALAVPIVLELNSTARIPRSTVEEVYAQALSDLTTGAKTIGKSKKNGFINYYGNLAIQARMAMHMQQWSTALTLCKEIMDGPYKLYTNANWVGSWAKQWGDESIIEFAVNDEEADLGVGSLGIMMVRSGDPVNTRATGYFVASDFWLDRMNEDPTDIRWGVMDEDELADAGKVPGRLGSCYKYVGGLARKGDGKAAPSAVNVKLCRLSEIYLIAAEAAFHNNDKTSAANYLKEISKRSPGLAEPTSATVTLDWILNEKSKECYGEGLRFWDRIRNNQTIEFNDIIAGGEGELPHPNRASSIDRTFFRCILPIDLDEINATGKDVLIQNPGY